MTADKRLQSWSGKTIRLEQIRTLLGADTEEELYRQITDAQDRGILSPVKASGGSGNRQFPLYLKYRILSGEEDGELQREIALLHPALVKNGYLGANPKLYKKYREPLRKLDRYLFAGGGSVPVSRKERSFAIFDEEKQLEDAAFCAFLRRAGLSEKELGFYETPEYCFNDFIPARKENMTLLICENKDIWFNIRRRMYEDGAGEIFGTAIDGAVYGCGNRVSARGALEQYLRFMGAGRARCLYWGDIDRAGLNIYLSLVKNNPDREIGLFVPAYVRMLEKAEGRQLPDSGDRRGLTGDYGPVLALFPEPLRERLQDCLERNKRIPQEIISYENLLTEMR